MDPNYRNVVVQFTVFLFLAGQLTTWLSRKFRHLRPIRSIFIGGERMTLLYHVINWDLLKSSRSPWGTFIMVFLKPTAHLDNWDWFPRIWRWDWFWELDLWNWFREFDFGIGSENWTFEIGSENSTLGLVPRIWFWNWFREFDFGIDSENLTVGIGSENFTLELVPRIGPLGIGSENLILELVPRIGPL